MGLLLSQGAAVQFALCQRHQGAAAALGQKPLKGDFPLLISFYFSERSLERLEFSLIGFSEEAKQTGCASPSDGEQVGKNRSGGEEVNGAAVWQIRVWQHFINAI